MSYVTPIDLLTTISMKYPTYQVSMTGDPNVYSNIQWGNETPVAEGTLLDDKLAIYRSLVDTKIRDEAQSQRVSKIKLVLGTTDMEQVRTYEEKYAEAKKYVADNASPTPIMSSEVAYTGETVSSLATRVIAEYEYAKNILQQMYGQIEGIRRNAISTIAAYTLVQLEAWAGPTWA